MLPKPGLRDESNQTEKWNHRCTQMHTDKARNPHLSVCICVHLWFQIAFCRTRYQTNGVLALTSTFGRPHLVIGNTRKQARAQAPVGSHVFYECVNKDVDGAGAVGVCHC